MMAARIGSGRVGQAATTTARAKRRTGVDDHDVAARADRRHVSTRIVSI
jgi:hypothetical protein